MIRVEKFKPEHMVNIEKKDPDSSLLELMGDIDTRAETYANSGPALTLFDDDTLLAVGGVIMFWQGVGEVWMMVSPEGRKKGLALFKCMSDFLNTCFNEYGFHRIQTSVLVSFQEAHKCIMRLGFIPEGMMAHYGPNKENYIRYVRL
jgi:RimJ/RimL family protein N-acetyltransferase